MDEIAYKCEMTDLMLAKRKTIVENTNEITIGEKLDQPSTFI